MSTRNTHIAFVLAVVFVFCFSLQAFGNNETATEKPSGKVSMTFGRGSFIVSAGGGHGVLTFNGVKYNFKIAEAGFGGIGGAKVTASGSVYNLKEVQSFAGTYAQLSAGVAAFNKGKGTLWLKNANGVVLKLKAREKGFELTAGGQGLVISLDGKSR